MALFNWRLASFWLGIPLGSPEPPHVSSGMKIFTCVDNWSWPLSSSLGSSQSKDTCQLNLSTYQKEFALNLSILGML